MDLYVIRRQDGRFVITCTAKDLGRADSADRVRQAIDRFAHRQNRFAAWIGRQLQSLHQYYLKLEDKLDPGERVLKAMATTKQFVVYSDAPADFFRVLRSQRWKHVFWFSLDALLTVVVILLTPILAPIPGPNVFFYYPVLRLLSHWRAIRGASSALNSIDVEFKHPPDDARNNPFLSG